MSYILAGATGMILMLVLIGFVGLGPTEMRSKGMILVASGQWSCELIEGPDKTTEWGCLENEK